MSREQLVMSLPKPAALGILGACQQREEMMAGRRLFKNDWTKN